MTAWQPPLPFFKGEGSGVGFGGNAQCGNAQCTMTAWQPPPPLSQEAAEKVINRELREYNANL